MLNARHGRNKRAEFWSQQGFHQRPWELVSIHHPESVVEYDRFSPKIRDDVISWWLLNEYTIVVQCCQCYIWSVLMECFEEGLSVQLQCHQSILSPDEDRRWKGCVGGVVGRPHCQVRRRMADSGRQLVFWRAVQLMSNNVTQEIQRWLGSSIFDITGPPWWVSVPSACKQHQVFCSSICWLALPSGAAQHSYPPATAATWGRPGQADSSNTLATSLKARMRKNSEFARTVPRYLMHTFVTDCAFLLVSSKRELDTSRRTGWVK